MGTPGGMERRRLLKAGLAVPAALVAGCTGGNQGSSAPSRTPSAPGPGTTPSPSPTPSPAPTPSDTAGPAPGTGDPHLAGTVARDLEVPWGLAFLPDGTALVGERDKGRVLRVGGGGTPRVVGPVPGVVSNVSLGGEGGLLGLVLDGKARWLYAYLSTDRDNRVIRMRYRTGRLGPPRPVLTGIRKAVHHNGGGLAFGPDGLLYVSTGDAERPADAQDTSSLNGKVLRLTATGSVPADNPFGNPVWTFGHRNVEGLAFDGDGNLWASEFGDQDKDELNLIERGSNYGWPYVQGKDGPKYHDPFAQWDTDACSPSGITVLGDRAWLGALQGECLYAVQLHGAERGRQRRYFAGRFGRLRRVDAAPDGSLWFTTSNRDGRGSPAPPDDRIFRLTFG